MRGETDRVQRLVRAYRLMDAEATATSRRAQALRRRIQAVLPQLTPEETDAYYVAVKRIREQTWVR